MSTRRTNVGFPLQTANFMTIDLLIVDKKFGITRKMFNKDTNPNVGTNQNDRVGS